MSTDYFSSTPEPQRAIVVPRAYSPVTGEPLPISSIVENLLSTQTKFVCLQGRGKTTALQHVAAEYMDSESLVVLSGAPIKTTFDDYPDAQLFVVENKQRIDNCLELTITPWSEDDVIEYLLAKHPQQCKSVMSRLAATDENWLTGGDPAIWSDVLDRLASDESIESIGTALLGILQENAPELLDNKRVGGMCVEYSDNPEKFVAGLASYNLSHLSKFSKFLRCPGVLALIATKQIANSVRQESGLETFFKHRWSDRLYDLVTSRFSRDSSEFQFLKKLADTPNDPHSAVAASLVVRIDCMWRPETQRPLRYRRASLPGVHWQKATLNNANLAGADLSGSRLTDAKMTDIKAWESDFSHSDLTDANLTKACMTQANLSRVVAKRVNLTCAYLSGARLDQSDFSYSNFQAAILENTDLTGANFTKACLQETRLKKAITFNANFFCANLRKSDLTGLDLSTCIFDLADLTNARLTNCSFEGCTLTNATLDCADCRRGTFTGSHFRGVSMSRCDFALARLADIDWEGCNLQEANFKQAIFHLGSTRCGLVDSPFPSHGTRTGFYTDEYNEQYFRRPEEIRKANLRGCDLLGANVFDTDFYLVDLRDAICDAEQCEHFQKCGAILN